MTLARPSTDPWHYALAEFAEPEPEPEPTPGIIASYLNRPADFARDLIRWPAGACLEDYQADILDTLAADHRLVVRGPHGLGKTTVEALAILWFAITRDAMGIDWKIPTTAGVGRQLSVYLWPEVHKWARRLRWDLIGKPAWREGRELLDQSIKLRHGEAFAATVNDAAAIEGAHARSLLFVFTEAKLIDSNVFDAAEGAFSGAGHDTADEAFALVQSTPGAPEGRFYDLCRRAPGTEDWTFKRVSKAQVIAAGRMSGEWAEARLRQWGADSPVYLNRVEGDFAAGDPNGVIPLRWVEAANDRWHEAMASGVRPLVSHIGVDVARYGDDVTVIVPICDDFVERPIRPGQGDSIETAEAVSKAAGTKPFGPLVVVDADGVGAGVFDQIRTWPDLALRTRAFHAGTATNWRDVSGELQFANLRSAAWWHLRELLDPRLGATLALPPDDLLTGDLTTPRWREVKGRILVEPKDEMRKRLHRSPDTGDTVMMGLWGRVMGRAAVLASPAAQRGEPMITAGILTEKF